MQHIYFLLYIQHVSKYITMSQDKRREIVVRFIGVGRIVISQLRKGARMAQWVRSLNLTAHTSLSPIRRGFEPSFVNFKKGCTRHASDKVYQLLVQGRWFSPGTPACSTTKTAHHDIAEILLKVALKSPQFNSIQFN